MTGSGVAPRAAECPLTVALADDHPVVRAGLTTLLQADDSVRVVAEFDDLSQTVSAVPALKPDVLVLDLVMAGESSLAAIPGCWPPHRA